jgi:hypothetical protein
MDDGDRLRNLVARRCSRTDRKTNQRGALFGVGIGGQSRIVPARAAPPMTRGWGNGIFPVRTDSLGDHDEEKNSSNVDFGDGDRGLDRALGVAIGRPHRSLQCSHRAVRTAPAEIERRSRTKAGTSILEGHLRHPINGCCVRQHQPLE